MSLPPSRELLNQVSVYIYFIFILFMQVTRHIFPGAVSIYWSFTKLSCLQVSLKNMTGTQTHTLLTKHQSLNLVLLTGQTVEFCMVKQLCSINNYYQWFSMLLLIFQIAMSSLVIIEIHWRMEWWIQDQEPSVSWRLLEFCQSWWEKVSLVTLNTNQWHVTSEGAVSH